MFTFTLWTLRSNFRIYFGHLFIAFFKIFKIHFYKNPTLGTYFFDRKCKFFSAPLDLFQIVTPLEIPKFILPLKNFGHLFLSSYHRYVYIIFGVKKSICLWECRNMLFSIFPLTFGGQKVPLFSKLLHNFEYLWGSKWLSAEAEKWIRLFQFCSNINHKFQLLHTLLRCCCCWS